MDIIFLGLNDPNLYKMYDHHLIAIYQCQLKLSIPARLACMLLLHSL